MYQIFVTVRKIDLIIKGEKMYQSYLFGKYISQPAQRGFNSTFLVAWISEEMTSQNDNL